MTAPWVWKHLAPAALLMPLAAPPTWAAALTDGSTGAVQSLSGHFTVPQSLGTVRGANLFHSFTRFGVAAGESATFSTTDSGLRHVITRVTGGQASVIDGGLRLDAAAGSRPAFWFINPAGVVVGAGAQVDVPGSLHLSTAPQLQMADGTVWDTRGGASTLSVAAPERFGFLSAPAAALRWQGSNLMLQPGSTLQLAAGDVALDQAILSMPGGRVHVQAQGSLTLTDGARIEASPVPGTSEPALAVDAGRLLLDGRLAPVGLSTFTDTAVAAGGGGLSVRVTGAAELLGYSEITSSHAAATAAGPLVLRAGSLRVDADGGLASVAAWSLGSGGGGEVQVTVDGAVELLAGGQIGSFALGSGRAGAVRLQAGRVTLDDRLLGLGTGLRAQGGTGAGANAAIELSTPGLLEVRNGAMVWSSTASADAPGALRVQAGSVRLDGGGATSQIGSLTTGPAPSADVRLVVAERLQVAPGGQISSGSLGTGAAGALQVQAAAVELQGRSGTVTGILSASLGPEAGRAGDVTVQAQDLAVLDSARISAASVSRRGAAGNVTVDTRRAQFDGGGLATGIESFGYGLAGGAGRVQVTATESLTLRNGASIVAGARGSGRAGEIEVSTGTLLIDGRDARQTYTGIGGDALGDGTGAAVTVKARQIDLREGGQISSGTFSDADAGSVTVSAEVLRVDGGGNAAVSSGISTDSGGAGRAGRIDITATEMVVANEGLVSSSAIGSGPGGPIRVQAQTLTLERSAGIFTVAADRGDAGRIDVQVAGALRLIDGGLIVANTGGSGAAGRVDIRAGTLTMSGEDDAGQRSRVSSRALSPSTGQPGSLTIDVTGLADLQPGALLSIANEATVQGTAPVQPTLVLRAGSLRLEGADITAAATRNAAAGAITLDTAGRLRLVGSTVRTSSLDGDGGPITLRAGGTVLLRDSRITTSVEGTRNGNGGSISLACPALVLQSGAVQANTAAPLARGGQVRVDAAVLLPDGNNAFVGGSRIQAVQAGVPGFNLIQAAAPDGVSGRLDVTLPQLDLSAALVGLSTRRLDLDGVGRDVCDVGPDSSFTTPGRGAVREPASAPLRVEAAPAARR